MLIYINCPVSNSRIINSFPFYIEHRQGEEDSFQPLKEERVRTLQPRLQAYILGVLENIPHYSYCLWEGLMHDWEKRLVNSTFCLVLIHYSGGQSFSGASCWRKFPSSIIKKAVLVCRNTNIHPYRWFHYIAEILETRTHLEWLNQGILIDMLSTLQRVLVTEDQWQLLMKLTLFCRMIKPTKLTVHQKQRLPCFAIGSKTIWLAAQWFKILCSKMFRHLHSSTPLDKYWLQFVLKSSGQTKTLRHGTNIH